MGKKTKKQGETKIILFMSNKRENAKEGLYSCPNGTEVIGTQTNEAPVKYLLQEYPEVSKIICLVTEEAKETAWHYFCEEIKNVSKDVEIVEIPYTLVDENETSRDSFNKVILPKILKQIGDNDKILLDITGGTRNINIRLLLLARILAYKDIEVEKMVYSQYNGASEFHKIEDVTPLFNEFDLINGMQEMTNFGSVKTLKKYYAENDTKEINNLISSMETLNESITLCRTNKLDDQLKDFTDNLNALKSCDDPLMIRLVPVFQNNFGKEATIPSYIKWCIENDMLQQAMTIYNERIAIYLFKQEIIQYDERKFKKYKCKAYQSKDTEIFRQEFLQIKPNPKRETLDIIKDLEDETPEGFEKIKKENVKRIQRICRDYVYIRNWRNNTNHGNSESTEKAIEQLNKLKGFGYKPDPTYEELKNAVTKALDHLE